MSKVSKRDIKSIRMASVFDSILRGRFESTLNGYFADHAPDTWDDDQREAFDMASEIEYQLKAEILKVLGVGTNSTPPKGS